jgi:hypothetical protein
MEAGAEAEGSVLYQTRKMHTNSGSLAVAIEW